MMLLVIAFMRTTYKLRKKQQLENFYDNWNSLWKQLMEMIICMRLKKQRVQQGVRYAKSWNMNLSNPSTMGRMQYKC